MWNRTIILCLALFALGSSSGLPGKVFLWSSEVTDTENTIITRTITPSFVSSLIEKNCKDFELLVFLQSNDGSSLFSDPNVVESFKKSQVKTTVQFVYQPEVAPSKTAISDNIMASPTLGKLLEVSVGDFSSEVSGDSSNGVLKNGKLDIFKVTAGAKDLDYSALFKNLTGKKVMFVVYDEPSLDASLPSYAHTTSRGLGSDLEDGVNYKPEGAEYSIYYQGTYLYITPDIFTGLMTGIFFFFVVLIGTSCLGSIQGMSSFYDKTPPVGREA